MPHGIAIDRQGVVYVADRENSRVQIFNRHGQFLGEWTDVARPCQVRVMANGDLIIAELGFRAAMWPGVSPPPNPTGGRLATLSLVALGVVYGDIGTSPLYALRECFSGTHPIPATRDNIYSYEPLKQEPES